MLLRFISVITNEIKTKNALIFIPQGLMLKLIISRAFNSVF